MLGPADINNAGTIAFGAALSTGGTAIYTYNSGILTQIAVSDSLVSITEDPRINQNGDLAWLSTLVSLHQEIQTNVGGATSTFVDTTGPYYQFGFSHAFDINILNEIVFAAILDSDVDPSGRVGIFTGPDPVMDSVIRNGDLLAGKTVLEAALGGINDCGQISFRAMFSDFSTGIFRADPSGRACNSVPEPSSLMLVSLGSIVLLGLIGRTKLMQGRRMR